MTTGPSVAALWWLAAHAGALGAIVVAAAGAGRLCLIGHPFKSGLERFVFTTALGLGICALVIFGLGLAGWLTTPAIAGLTIAAAAPQALLALGGAYARRRGIVRRLVPQSIRQWAITGFVCLAAICWASLWARTLFPPVEWDGISHHLTLARYFLEDRRVAPQLGLPYPLLPELHHMLFVWALALRDDLVTQMIEHLFLVLTALGLFAWGRRLGGGLAFSFALGSFAVAHPLMLWLSESAYVDLGVTCYVFLGIYALRVFWDERGARWWYLSMTFFGLAAGVRYQGLFFIAVGATVGLWRLGRMNRWGALAGGWALALLVAAPWYGFVAYQTGGDPVWPILPQLARGLWAAPRVIRDWRSMYISTVEPRTLVNFLRLPFDWVRQAPRFVPEVSGPLLPLLLAWPLAWIVMFKDRSVRWWTLWALAYTLAWFSGAHVLRYWLPGLPLAGVALYESVRWLAARLRLPRAIQTTAWSLLAVASLWSATDLSARQVIALGRPPVVDIARRTFLLWNLGGYWAVDYVNRHAGPNDRAYVVNASWLNYYLAPRATDYVGILQHGKWPVFRWPDDAAWVRDLDLHDINWVVVNHVYKPRDAPIVPEDLPNGESFWPDFEVAYADPLMWVFRRKLPPPTERLVLPPKRQPR